MMIGQANPPHAFSSLDNALRILNLFSMDEPELGITELADRMGIAKSTVHRLVTTLMSEGFIARDPQTHLYRLGTSVLALGHVVQSRLNLHATALPVLEHLVQQTNETAHIGILKGTDVIYLTKVECSHPVRLLSHVGKRNPGHCTSSGQILLAYLSPSRLDDILRSPLSRHTKKTITDRETLRHLLKKIKQQGFSVSVEELHEGVTSIAAPVRNNKGEVAAAVTIAGPIQRINHNTVPQLVKMVVHAGHEISERLRSVR